MLGGRAWPDASTSALVKCVTFSSPVRHTVHLLTDIAQGVCDTIPTKSAHFSTIAFLNSVDHVQAPMKANNTTSPKAFPPLPPHHAPDPTTCFEAAEHPQHAARDPSTQPPSLWGCTSSYDNGNVGATLHPAAQALRIDSACTEHTAAAVPVLPPLMPNVSTGTAEAPVVDTFDMSQTAAALLEPPTADATREDSIDFLHQQLDSIGAQRDILEGLVLLGSGSHERLQGGAPSSPPSPPLYPQKIKARITPTRRGIVLLSHMCFETYLSL